MTYARARLWLGISGVGFWVILSLVMIVLAVPVRWFAPVNPTGVSVGWEDWSALSQILFGYILLSAPFDFLGGYWLPRAFRRWTPSPQRFFLAWLRGVLGQAFIFLLTGTGILLAGRAFGRIGAIGSVTVLMLGLLLTQGWLARLIGGMQAAAMDMGAANRILESWGLRAPATTILKVTDPAFVGGFVGLPGFERLILPASWGQTDVKAKRLGALLPEGLALQIARRVGVLERGSRQRGVWIGLLWNLIGFSLATFLPNAGVTSVPGLLTTACGFTLWSFLGLLTLPSLSRPGVLEADHFAAEKGVPRALIERTIALLDQRQDDEPARSPLVETIFHPIPSVRSRVSHLTQNSSAPVGAWQAARVALFLSWGCWGFLSRAVHCNSGRPELWVLFPGD